LPEENVSSAAVLLIKNLLALELLQNADMDSSAGVYGLTRMVELDLPASPA
jgi:hypothetical protein